MKHIRWQQRFENLEKAFLQLGNAVKRIDELDDLSKEGLIQRFEYTFELSWKTLKDYLESEGLPCHSPRDTIKTAFLNHIISEGEAWMDMLEQRNLLAHTYREENLKTAIISITNSYFPCIESLVHFLKKQATCMD
jgi:nucleotidyltransferase substrate binding protein (TIGR01987 family)